ncbi:TFIIB-type zinc ribbon-containing protein [Frankia nepalensis]|uniref:Uncharacterized protein n=1 Tax=Frankia nepalensis TaxID=1836974 RepID=A0A937RJQ0_9ACTN|nr:hypothetical protein [Frankia nepalensis]MBL7631512.1 hypothetical protein [Frankia nepalensis]
MTWSSRGAAGGMWAYRYVGPAEVRASAAHGAAGRVIRSRGDLEAWLTSSEGAEAREPFTFVIGVDGVLRLAPRRSEHVACAGGGQVLSAGEITFARGPEGWECVAVTNQSTGYCPEVASWPAVADALDRAGVPHPGQFTDGFVFRRCPRCGERNIVREGDFVCALCDGKLPESWNFDSAQMLAADDKGRETANRARRDSNPQPFDP